MSKRSKDVIRICAQHMEDTGNPGAAFYILDMLEQNEKMAAMLKGILAAYDSEPASGGEMWYAEKVYSAIERERGAIEALKQRRMV